MDQDQSPKLKNLRQFIRSDQFLTKFLLSVSVFSLFFSHSTFDLSFSTLPLKLFTHTIDKNFMFLFCNGLLVFLAKFSRLRSPPPKHNLSSDYMKSYEDVPQPESIGMQSEMSLLEETMVEENDETMEDRENELLVEEVEREKPSVKVEEEEEKEEENDVLLEEEEEELGEGSVALLSTEELNKKFDEFIRKMKEELRIGARQQLIMV